jgi:hypothetical protein
LRTFTKAGRVRNFYDDAPDEDLRRSRDDIRSIDEPFYDDLSCGRDHIHHTPDLRWRNNWRPRSAHLG